MIELINICKGYNNKLILNNLTHTFARENLYLIKGRNGVGKTTLLNIIYNITEPSSGDYFYGGVKISRENQKIKNRVGFFHTNATYLIQDFTISEYIDFYLKYKSQTIVERDSSFSRIMSILKKMYFVESATTKISKLSTGTKMKLSLACVFSRKLDFIILDEPFANLDSDSVNALTDLIYEAKSSDKTSFLIATHSDMKLNLLFDNVLELG